MQLPSKAMGEYGEESFCAEKSSRTDRAVACLEEFCIVGHGQPQAPICARPLWRLAQLLTRSARPIGPTIPCQGMNSDITLGSSS